PRVTSCGSRRSAALARAARSGLLQDHFEEPPFEVNAGIPAEDVLESPVEALVERVERESKRADPEAGPEECGFVLLPGQPVDPGRSTRRLACPSHRL